MGEPVEVLPWLPRGWLDGIAAGDYVERARGEVNSSKAAFAWIKKRPESKGEPCKQMQQALDTGRANLLESSSGAAHDELTARVYQLVSLAVEGHRGCYTAVVGVGEAFVDEVAGRRRSAVMSGEAAGTVRSQGEARAEVRRAVMGAVKLMIGHLSQPEMVEAGLSEGSAACACWDEPGGVDAGSARDPYTYELTDIGNSEQLIDLVDGQMVWVPAHEAWFGWDDNAKLWEASSASYGMQFARRIPPRVKLAAEQRFRAAESANGTSTGEGLSDAEILLVQGKKLMLHAERCGQRAALSNMLEVAKSFPEMVVEAEEFDQQQRLLHCAGGTVLELNDDGLLARVGERSDRLTQSTGVPYVQGATDPLWEDYLDTFIPDRELRWFVQRLLGYSLMGGNPRRLLVFLHGPTSSGKSTIVEAASAAVGQYGGAFGMSVFREKQDEAPRADLVRILDQRIAFASEAGSEWYLHADQVKRMTGGDSIVARLPHAKHYIEKVPQFTPFIATNATPRINGADSALWRRLLAVPFDMQVSGDKDDTLARDRLRASPSARTAVLAWCARGWEGYAAEGLDDVPDVVVKRTSEMKREVSDFHTWFFTACELGDDYSAPAGELYQNYRSYCLASYTEERNIMSATAFGRALTAQSCPSARKRVNGATVVLRMGLRFKGTVKVVKGS